MKMQIISSLLVDLTLISPCLLHLLRSLCKAMASPARPLQGTAAGARMCSDALFLPYPCPIPALSLGLTPKKPSDLGDRPASPVGAPGMVRPPHDSHQFQLGHSPGQHPEGQLLSESM